MKHVHKYKRILIGKKDYYVYKCMLSGCPHHVQVQAAIGRESVCWGCGKTITITQNDLDVKKVRPICEDCKEYRRIKKEQLVSVPEFDEFEGEEFEE